MKRPQDQKKISIQTFNFNDINSQRDLKGLLDDFKAQRHTSSLDFTQEKLKKKWKKSPSIGGSSNNTNLKGAKLTRVGSSHRYSPGQRFSTTPDHSNRKTDDPQMFNMRALLTTSKINKKNAQMDEDKNPFPFAEHVEQEKQRYTIQNIEEIEETPNQSSKKSRGIETSPRLLSSSSENQSFFHTRLLDSSNKKESNSKNPTSLKLKTMKCDEIDDIKEFTQNTLKKTNSGISKKESLIDLNIYQQNISQIKKSQEKYQLNRETDLIVDLETNKKTLNIKLSKPKKLSKISGELDLKKKENSPLGESSSARQKLKIEYFGQIDHQDEEERSNSIGTQCIKQEHNFREGKTEKKKYNYNYKDKDNYKEEIDGGIEIEKQKGDKALILNTNSNVEERVSSHNMINKQTNKRKGEKS